MITEIKLYVWLLFAWMRPHCLYYRKYLLKLCSWASAVLCAGRIQSFNAVYTFVPVVACPKLRVCGPSLVGLTGSNPAGVITVHCECCVLSGIGSCDQLITRPEESYWVWCVVCDLETWSMRMPWLPLRRIYLCSYHYAMKINNLVLRICFPKNHFLCSGNFPCDIPCVRYACPTDA
jgi:hypothetical protein